MFAEPQSEHRWLQKMVGSWTFESECSMGPDQPPMKATGSETVRSLGGLWVLCEGQGEMPGGGPCSTLMTLGFDPEQKRFVGTFVASMMTNLWIYNGALDPSNKVLTLDTEGPNMSVPGTMARYQDIIEFKSDDHRMLTSRMRGDDGTWSTIMTANFRRKK